MERQSDWPERLAESGDFFTEDQLVRHINDHGARIIRRGYPAVFLRAEANFLGKLIALPRISLLYSPPSLFLFSFAVSFSIHLSIGRKKTRLEKERKKEEWKTTSRENGDAVIVEDAEREFLFPDTIEANYFRLVTPFNWCFLIDCPRSVRNTNFRCSNSVSRLSFGTWNPSYSIQSGTLLRMSLCFPL